MVSFITLSFLIHILLINSYESKLSYLPHSYYSYLTEHYTLFKEFFRLYTKDGGNISYIRTKMGSQVSTKWFLGLRTTRELHHITYSTTTSRFTRYHIETILCVGSRMENDIISCLMERVLWQCLNLLCFGVSR